MMRTVSFGELKESINNLEEENRILRAENAEFRQVIESVYDNVFAYVEDEPDEIQQVISDMKQIS